MKIFFFIRHNIHEHNYLCLHVPVSPALIKDGRPTEDLQVPFLVSFSRNRVEISLCKSQLASLKKQCTLVNNSV